MIGFLGEAKAEGRAEGLAAGRAEGKAEILLRLLALQKLELTEMQRAEVLQCRSDHRFDIWLQRALIAKSVDELFED